MKPLCALSVTLNRGTPILGTAPFAAPVLYVLRCCYGGLTLPGWKQLIPWWHWRLRKSQNSTVCVEKVWHVPTASRGKQRWGMICQMNRLVLLHECWKWTQTCSCFYFIRMKWQNTGQNQHGLCFFSLVCSISSSAKKLGSWLSPQNNWPVRGFYMWLTCQALLRSSA